MIILGIDTGGTFTDFVLLQGNKLRIHKVLSTPDAPERAILQGVEEMGLAGQLDQTIFIVHGSTVATNAVLEGKGVATVFITNHGMGDTLTIGRQARRELYNLQPEYYTGPVSKAYCLETGGRVDADGSVIEPLTEQHLEQLIEQLEHLKPQAVAINLLFSFLRDDYEKQIESRIQQLNKTSDNKLLAQPLFVSRSSQILPEYKEYERGIATWLNASVGPIVQGYLQRLEQGLQTLVGATSQYGFNVSVMQSSGGTITAKQAASQAVNMLLSGPAGGMAGAQYIAACSQQNRILTFDMGGTSTDVAMIDGELQLTTEGNIGNYPVAVPMVDMHTIGAGGGSIAYVDKGGLLRVGPQSAGADPGPACYGLGGSQVTVTDANLILGRLRAEAFLGGNMALDETAAQQGMQKLAQQLDLTIDQTAQGIIDIANSHMAAALRVMSVQRGIDPRELTLVSFGGAGGLHVCALAEAMGMSNAMVPIHAGVLSAFGMLVAQRSRHLSHTYSVAYAQLEENELSSLFQAMSLEGQAELINEGVPKNGIDTQFSVDMRYTGQSFCLNIHWMGPKQTLQQFHSSHLQRYGHQLKQAVELVTARVKCSGKTQHADLAPLLELKPANPGQVQRRVSLHNVHHSVPVYVRQSLAMEQVITGPALITETVSTTYIAKGWKCCCDLVGNLQLTPAM